MDICEVISEQRILLETIVENKESALHMLANTFYKDGIITSIQGFLEDVEKRELESCTYIGSQTAIPHAISEYVTEASIAFLKVEHGVVYDPTEDRARLLFMLAIPRDSNAKHLRMLSMLATQLMHQEFREKLIEAKTVTEVYDVLKQM